MDVGVLKIEETPSDPFKHGLGIAHDVVMALACQLRYFEAGHGELVVPAS